MESASTILSVVASQSSPYFFPHYLINGIFFKKNFIEHEFVFSFYLQIILSETFLIVRKVQLDIIINVNRSLR
jgi:hypothetical protein